MDPHISSYVHAATAGCGAAAPNGACRLNKEEDAAAFVDVDVEAARYSLAKTTAQADVVPPSAGAEEDGGSWGARVGAVCAASSLGLAGFGAAGAHLGGANIVRSGTRVLLGGWLAMLVTYGVLRLFGTLFHMDVSSSG
ncbi:hypothetical protein ABZP36_003201 [Zizania latifolia]